VADLLLTGGSSESRMLADHPRGSTQRGLSDGPDASIGFLFSFAAFMTKTKQNGFREPFQMALEHSGVFLDRVLDGAAGPG
jgi:hypothetical protein